MQKHKYEYADESTFSFMFQDAQGFLWGADMKGRLIRYDGWEIRHYSVDPSDSTSFSGGRLWQNTSQFIQDKKGKIWIKTNDGTIPKNCPA